MNSASKSRMKDQYPQWHPEIHSRRKQLRGRRLWYPHCPSRENVFRINGARAIPGSILLALPKYSLLLDIIGVMGKRGFVVFLTARVSVSHGSATDTFSRSVNGGCGGARRSSRATVPITGKIAEGRRQEYDPRGSTLVDVSGLLECRASLATCGDSTGRKC